MRRIEVKRLVLLLLAGVLVLAACQSAADNLTEKIVEQSAGVEDVSIDKDTGELSIETDEGSIKIGGGEIPDGFPVPLPDGGEVTSIFDSPKNMLVSLTYPAAQYEELVAFFDGWSTDQGGEWNKGNTTFDQGDGILVRTANWFGNDIAITINDCPDLSTGDDNLNAACVTVAAGSDS